MAVGPESRGNPQQQALVAIVDVARSVGLLDDGGTPPAQGGKPPVRKPQTLRWPVPAEVDYGTALSSLPELVVEHGPRGAQPVYQPPRDGRTPAFGDYTLSVTVAGDAEYEDATLERPLHVRLQSRPITVAARTAFMPHGGPLPPFEYELVSGTLVGDDRLVVEWVTEATADSAPDMDGYPLRPVVALAGGKTSSYAITVQDACVKVHRRFEELEPEITRLRHRWLALPQAKRKGALSDVLDDIAKHRMKDDLAKVDGLLRSLERDIEQAEYVPAQTLTIAALPAPPLAGSSVKLSALLQPSGATPVPLEWIVNDGALGSIAPDGTLTIAEDAPAEGLRVIVSRARDELQFTLPVPVKPLPAEVEWIDPPTHLFFGQTATLKARVRPAEAAQEVEFKAFWEGGRPPKNGRFSPKDRTLGVDAPSASGGKRAGRVKLVALAAGRAEVQAPHEVTYGGYEAQRIDLKPDRREVLVGERIVVGCSVVPSEADQGVAWSLDSLDVARLENETDQSVEVVTIGSGPVMLTATAQSGGLTGTVKLTARRECKGFRFTASSTSADITDTIALTGVFDPPEARGRIDWTVKPANAAEVVNNQLQPLATGDVTITGTLPGTAFSHTLKLKITSDENRTVGPGSWRRVRDLVRRYAEKVHLTATPSGQVALDKWLYTMQQDVEGGAQAPSLKDLATAVKAMRDQNYKLTHEEWLETAGFSAGGNCYIRDDDSLAHGTETYSVHMTQFPTGASIEIGTSFDALEKKVYRANATKFVCMHATLYLDSTKTNQLKTYVSGEDWTPPYTVVQALGGAVACNALKHALKTWMEGRRAVAKTALETAYTRVKENDAAKLA